METVYTVAGMTCGHCVSAVSEEIGKLDGVAGVQVDLATGAVTVSPTQASVPATTWRLRATRRGTR